MKELVFLQNKQPVTTSLIVAENTKNQHESLVRLINEHKTRFEHWGQIYFTDLKSGNKNGDLRGRPTKVAILNEPQATFLITLLRNNDVVLDFKEQLVDQFYKMRSILLNRQNEEWRAIRQAGKRGNKEMRAVIQQALLPLAREQGYDKPEKFLYINYNNAINRAAKIQPHSRDELSLGQLYEVEKMQNMVEVSIRGLAARGDNYKQIYKDTNQTLENYSRLSLIAERFLPA